MTRSIRLALPEDSSALADVNIASWRAAYGDLLPAAVLYDLTPEFATERWRLLLDRLNDGSFDVLVVEVEGRIVAYSRSGPSRDEPADAGEAGEIYGFYVHPEHWGTGVGRQLMERVLEAMRERGLERVTLNVVEANTRARAFYERQGFVPDRPASPWYGVPQLRYRREL